MNIVATKHALARWRERFAIYGDETIIDMRAVLEKVFVKYGKPVKGKSFCIHDNTMFVISNENNEIVIITVYEINKQMKGVVVEDEFVINIPVFSDVLEKREWLKHCLDSARQLQNKELRRNTVAKLEKELSLIRKEAISLINRDKMLKRLQKIIDSTSLPC